MHMFKMRRRKKAKKKKNYRSMLWANGRKIKYLF